MTFASLVINVRRMLDDARAAKFTVNDVGFWLNEAARLVQGQLKVAKVRTSIALVANQREYAIDATLLEPQAVIYGEANQQVMVEHEAPWQFARFKTLTASYPTRYTFVDDERTIFLWPTPSTADTNTTLNGAITSTATTITLTDAGSFNDEGRGIVESEVVQWASKSGNDLKGVTRAVENTTAASHANAKTFTARSLMLYGVRRIRDREMWRYYTAGTIAVTNASKAVTGTSTSWVNDVVAGDYIGITTDSTRVDPVPQYKIDTVDTDTGITLKDNYLEDTASAQSYIISDPNPIPERFDSLLVTYALAMLLKREGDARLSGAYMQDFEMRLRRAKQEYLHSDQVIYPRGTRDVPYSRRSRFPVDLYNQVV